jgi:hypothetical protein
LFLSALISPGDGGKIVGHGLRVRVALARLLHEGTLQNMDDKGWQLSGHVVGNGQRFIDVGV